MSEIKFIKHFAVTAIELLTDVQEPSVERATPMEMAELFFDVLGEAVHHDKNVQMVVAGFTPNYYETAEFLVDCRACFVMAMPELYVIKTQKGNVVHVHILQNPIIQQDDSDLASL